MAVAVECGARQGPFAQIQHSDIPPVGVGQVNGQPVAVGRDPPRAEFPLDAIPVGQGGGKLQGDGHE